MLRQTRSCDHRFEGWCHGRRSIEKIFIFRSYLWKSLSVESVFRYPPDSKYFYLTSLSICFTANMTPSFPCHTYQARSYETLPLSLQGCKQTLPHSPPCPSPPPGSLLNLTGFHFPRPQHMPLHGSTYTPWSLPTSYLSHVHASLCMIVVILWVRFSLLHNKQYHHKNPPMPLEVGIWSDCLSIQTSFKVADEYWVTTNHTLNRLF